MKMLSRKQRMLTLLVLLVMVVAALVPLALLRKKANAVANDQNTLTITVPYGRVDAFLAAVQEKFPDINFVIEYYVGDNGSMYLSDQIRHGDSSDIIFYSTSTSMPVDTEQMLDLSGYAFVGNISESVLATLSVDDHIYQIPGPLDVRCMVYNKTMFEEHGWKVPTNFEEQLAVIRQIREEAPEITPLTMAFIPAYAFVLPATLSQASFISTSAGYEWEQGFFAGERSYGEGMDVGFTQLEMLVEADAFDAEKSLGADQCNLIMLGGEAAMYYCWGGLRSFLLAEDTNGSEYEFDLLPFYGINDGDMVVGYNGSSMWSINKRLAEAGNEKKLENALRFMEWLVSAEGQELLSKSRGQVPVTRDWNTYDPRIGELLEIAQNGFKAFGAYTGYEHMLVQAGQIIQDAILAGDTTGMREKAVAVADELNVAYATTGQQADYFAMLMEDIDEAETAQLMVNMLQHTGMGDFALITHTDVKSGVANQTGTGGSLYAGPIDEQRILVINARRAYLVTTIELTGAEVKTLLTEGKPVRGSGDLAEAVEYFDYYWAGLDVVMEDGKVASARLNGVELADDQTYTVVFSQNDYPTEYAERAVISTLLVSKAMQAYMAENPEIYPPEVLRK